METGFPHRKLSLFVNITVSQGLKYLNKGKRVARFVVPPVLYVDSHILTGSCPCSDGNCWSDRPDLVTRRLCPERRPGRGLMRPPGTRGAAVAPAVFRGPLRAKHSSWRPRVFPEPRRTSGALLFSHGLTVLTCVSRDVRALMFKLIA